MNRNEVLSVLAILNEVYPRRIGSGDAKKTAVVWSAVLADADPKQVLAAAVAWVRGNKPHPPSPGELLASMVVAESETAEEAWGVVRKEIARVGYTGEPNLSPEARRAIEAVGGPWEVMCRTLLSGELVALRARFLEAYRNLGEKDSQVAALQQADSLLELAAPIANQYRLQDEKGGEGGSQPG